MKNMLRQVRHYTGFLAFLCTLLILGAGCNKMADVTTNTRNNAATGTDDIVSGVGYHPVLLTANKASYGAPHIDPDLLNAWGLSSGPSGILWVSAADAGLSYVYNQAGEDVIPPVTIPSHEAGVPGNPTGNIYNPTTDFIIPGTGLPSRFIFASEDGTISAWNGGTSAVIVADEHKHASYKGLAIANDDGENFLYVTNFEKARIDIFDKNFQQVHGKPFRDDNIPDGYAPFNIRNIDNMLYVTYALRTADGEEDSTGVGLGFVDVYKPDGHFSKRFATQGKLNAPWGITPTQHVAWRPDYILIGNFGDGRINAFYPDGTFVGQMQNMGQPLEIEGLWAIETQITGVGPKQMYFTAGPNDEEDGVFGYIEKNPQ